MVSIFESLVLFNKWATFLLTFYTHSSWIMETREGTVYLRDKLKEMGCMGIKLGQYMYSNKLIVKRENLDLFNIIVAGCYHSY